jgi:predicted nucleic acid-binding protein
MIKKFYFRINEREIFQTQLIEHNKRRFNILALKDLKRHIKENSRSKKIEFTHTWANKDSLNLKLIKIISRSINQFSQRNSSQSSIHWCSIRKLDVKTRISNLTSVAIVFVKEQRLKKTKKSSNWQIRFQRESDFNWIMNYDVYLHELITCWIRN